jgi:hypothetical protein
MREAVVKFPDDLDVERDQIGSADWRGSPTEVLDHVDELLKPHGLEIVMLSEGFATDCHYWRIEPRAK